MDTLLSFATLLNEITNPVKWIITVCFHVKMTTLDLDVNFTYFILRGQLAWFEKS